MDGSVIREFLVSLGFKIDESGLKKFNASISGLSKSIVSFAVDTERAAIAVVAATIKIADQLDKVYWAAARTNSSAAGIRQLGFAAQQLGASAQDASSSLDGLARFMRTNPGAESWISGLGVQTRNANGSLRKTDQIMVDLGHRFREMPRYLAEMYAGFAGITPEMLRVMLDPTSDAIRKRYAGRLKALGIDYEAITRRSKDFMQTLRDHVEVYKLVGQSLAMHLIDRLSDLMSWFDRIDPQARSFILVIGGLAAAFAILNIPIIGTIAAVALLGLAILGLYDDYKTWKTGGDSLINWGKWEPQIQQATTAISDLGKAFGDLGETIADTFGPILKEALDIGLNEGLKSVIAKVRLAKHLLKGEWGAAWEDLQEIGKQGLSVVDRGVSHVGVPVARLLGKGAFAGLERKYDLPPGVLDALWQVESSRGTNMKDSPKGAQGHFQFTPAAAKDYGLKNPYDLSESADAAARYLRNELNRNGGDLRRALAAYNWGPEALRKGGMNNLPRQTRDHISRVLSAMNENADALGGAALAPSPMSMPGYPVTNSNAPIMNQTTQIIVNGSSNTEDTAHRVLTGQSRVNADMVRNLQGAIR